MSSIFAPQSIPNMPETVGASASVSWSHKTHKMFAAFGRAPKGISASWKLPAERTYADGSSIRGSASRAYVDVLAGAADGKWMVRFSAQNAPPKTLTGEGDLADALAAAAAGAADYARSIPCYSIFGRDTKLASLADVAL